MTSRPTIRTPGLTPAQRLALRAACYVDERALGALYSGGVVRSTIRARVERAARELDLPLPPAAQAEAVETAAAAK